MNGNNGAFKFQVLCLLTQTFLMGHDYCNRSPPRLPTLGGRGGERLPTIEASSPRQVEKCVKFSPSPAPATPILVTKRDGHYARLHGHQMMGVG